MSTFQDYPKWVELIRNCVSKGETKISFCSPNFNRIRDCLRLTLGSTGNVYWIWQRSHEGGFHNYNLSMSHFAIIKLFLYLKLVGS